MRRLSAAGFWAAAAGVLLTFACGSDGEPPRPASGALGPLAQVEGMPAREGIAAQLVVRHRCGACHGDLPSPGPPPAFRPPNLHQVMEVLLAGPARHPDFQLSREEALAVALATADADAPGAPGGRELRRLRREHPAASAELGARIAAGLNCGGCHAGLPAQPGVAPPLAVLVAGTSADWLRQFLLRPDAVRPFGTRPGSGARMPRFAFDALQSDSLSAYLRSRAAPRPNAAVPGPLSPARTATADALLDRLGCRGCHEYGGRGGRVGPALDDVAFRRLPEYIAAIVRDPGRLVPGAPMPRMEHARLDDVVALLAHGATAPSAAAQTPAGREYLSALEHPLLDGTAEAPAYGFWCAPCHGAAGGGDGYNARYLAVRPASHSDADSMAARADDTLYDGIAAGGASLGRSPEMPPFGAMFDAARMRELVARIRTLCRCAGPAWAVGS